MADIQFGDESSSLGLRGDVRRDSVADKKRVRASAKTALGALVLEAEGHLRALAGSDKLRSSRAEKGRGGRRGGRRNKQRSGREKSKARMLRESSAHRVRAREGHGRGAGMHAGREREVAFKKKTKNHHQQQQQQPPQHGKAGEEEVVDVQSLMPRWGEGSTKSTHRQGRQREMGGGVEGGAMGATRPDHPGWRPNGYGDPSGDLDYM